MKRKIYSFLGLIIGICGIILSAATKKFGGNLYIYIFAVSLVFSMVSVFELRFLFLKKEQREEPEIDEKKLPEYRRKSAVMTVAEINFYAILKNLFQDRYEVLPQVALHSVIDKLTQNSYRSELFRIADFCLADKETFSPLILIELNDSSHKRADRIERDKKVAAICERAGLPLVAVTPQDLNDIPQVKRTIMKSILKR